MDRRPEISEWTNRKKKFRERVNSWAYELFVYCVVLAIIIPMWIWRELEAAAFFAVAGLVAFWAASIVFFVRDLRNREFSMATYLFALGWLVAGIAAEFFNR